MMWIVAAAAVLVAAATALDTYGEPSVVFGAWDYAVMLALAVSVSAVSSMVGLGGGLIIVPALTFMGMPPPVAASASLAATLSNAVGSASTYARQNRIDYKMGIRMGALAAPGSILGAMWSSGAEPGIFGAMLAAILVLAAFYVFIRPRLGRRLLSHTHVVAALSASTSFLAGIVSSYFGVGGGVIFIPLMVAVLGMSITRAAPTSMFALILTSTAGVMAHALLGHTDAVLALLLSAGGLAGGLAGARLSMIMRDRYLRMMAAALMSTVAAKLAWDAASSYLQ